MDRTSPVYSEENEIVDGRIIIRDNFDKLLENNNKIFIFGEDVGLIGDVNQGLEGYKINMGKIEFLTQELENQLLLDRVLVCQ